MRLDITRREKDEQVKVGQFGRPDYLHGDVGVGVTGVFEMNAQYRPMFMNAQFDANTLRSRMATMLRINKEWTNQKAAAAVYAEAQQALDDAPGIQAEARASAAVGYQSQDFEDGSSFGVNVSKDSEMQPRYSAQYSKPMAGGSLEADVGYSRDDGASANVRYSKRF